MNLKLLADLWCNVMHPAPMWPLHGRYQCPTCFRSYPVPWEHESGIAAPSGTERVFPVSVAVPAGWSPVRETVAN